MKSFVIVSLLFLALLYRPTRSQDAISSFGPLKAFLQTNFVGLPLVHNKQTWIFDPDVAVRRRKQFISLHGDKGDKLIERLGLGVDGNEEVRLERQRLRDDGHLGGLNNFLP